MKTLLHIEPFRSALEGDWAAEIEKDEWYLSRIIERTADALSPDEAFLAIDEAVNLMIPICDPYARYYCGSLLNALARKSDTSEMPPDLQEGWDTIEMLLQEHSDLWPQLERWYRA